MLRIIPQISEMQSAAKREHLEVQSLKQRADHERSRYMNELNEQQRLNDTLYAELQQNVNSSSFVSQNAANEVEKIRKQLEDTIRREQDLYRVHTDEKARMEVNYATLQGEYETATDHLYHETNAARAKRTLFQETSSKPKEFELSMSDNEYFDRLGAPPTAAAAASDEWDNLYRDDKDHSQSFKVDDFDGWGKSFARPAMSAKDEAKNNIPHINLSPRAEATKASGNASAYTMPAWEHPPPSPFMPTLMTKTDQIKLEALPEPRRFRAWKANMRKEVGTCLLYTSDAADE